MYVECIPCSSLLTRRLASSVEEKAWAAWIVCTWTERIRLDQPQKHKWWNLKMCMSCNNTEEQHRCTKLEIQRRTGKISNVFDFSLGKQKLLRWCGVIYVGMHYSEVLLQVLWTRAWFELFRRSSVPVDHCFLSSMTCAFQTDVLRRQQILRADIGETNQVFSKVFIKIIQVAQCGKSPLVMEWTLHHVLTDSHPQVSSYLK